MVNLVKNGKIFINFNKKCYCIKFIANSIWEMLKNNENLKQFVDIQ